MAEDISFIEAFSHVIAFRTGDGLVLFDTSLEAFAPNVLLSLRKWSNEPISNIIFTHGHVDHVGGAGACIQEAATNGCKRPRVIGHENILPRFVRCEMTNGYNYMINARQFGLAQVLTFNSGETGLQRFGPNPFVEPDTTFSDHLEVRVSETLFELHHAIGETDDHLWAWLPAQRVICSGDFVSWVFPNAGNPQKVQRYPLEWARALREMSAYEPELLLPAHGLPIAGKERISRALGTIATALETLVEQTLRLMNSGATLDDIIHAVKLPDSLMQKPYLQPIYDEPEFIIHNIWRLYGGWYNGNPAQLKPAPDHVLAQELSSLVGGSRVLSDRAEALVKSNQLRLACHLAEMAVQATPEDAHAHAVRAAVYGARRRSEVSLMAQGIFGFAERQSAEKAAAKE